VSCGKAAQVVEKKRVHFSVSWSVVLHNVAAAGIEERDGLLLKVIGEGKFVFNAVGSGGHGRYPVG
jgi:hypothetical protein